jgi:ABC-type glutathione transport system ATPase component
MTGEPVLDVRDLVVNYGTRAAPRPNAVDRVDLRLEPGETLALVGESGSGKSSVARAILGLTPRTGTVEFEGRELGGLAARELRRTRARIQMIFQDPYGTLDPRMPVGRQIAEPLLSHRMETAATVRSRVAGLLDQVGLDPTTAGRYPHEFSGGQRQRIAIARAVGLSPSVIVCDEPTSALDVSVQAQILDLLTELQREHGIAYLFIAHNLGVVRQVSHRVAVMYLGRIIETGVTDEVFDAPREPYTRALLDAVLEPDPSSRTRPPSVPRDATSPVDVGGGAA